MVVDDPCPVCHGSGRGRSTKTMQVRIPAGVTDGQRIRLKGKGGAGENGGAAGDLYVVVHVRSHPIFGRKGDNLTLTAPVTFDEAALGAEIEIPTLGGPSVRLKIPAGTPNGRTFRVRGKGVSKRDGSTGDLLVSVEVVVPEALSDEARQALDSYAAGGGPGEPAREAVRRELREQIVSASSLPERIDPDAPVFVISVAAHLAGMHPQTLRTYDRMGLVSPRRTGQARPPLLRPRHRPAAADPAAVPGRGHQPRGHPSHPAHAGRDRRAAWPAERGGPVAGGRARRPAGVAVLHRRPGRRRASRRRPTPERPRARVGPARCRDGRRLSRDPDGLGQSRSPVPGLRRR